MNKLSNISFIISCVGIFLTGILVGLIINKNLTKSDIISTTPIEPYKVVLTKVDGKVVRTFHYKQQ